MQHFSRRSKLAKLCDGAGDMWEEGEMMRLLKSNLAQRTEDNRVPYENMLRLNQVRPELVIIDPNDS